MGSKTRNIRLVLQYEGTRYQGWQRQKLGEATIQAKLEAVLSRVTSEPTNVIGASRTDAGVHAEAQVANFHTGADLTAAELLAACRRYLPEDIAVAAASEVPERFHARYLARAKRYVYRIRNRPHHDVFRRRFEYHEPRPLDIGAMRQAAAGLVGRHDFAGFCSARRGNKGTIRELTRAEVTESGGLVEIHFEGAAFLHGMARIMAGTLLEVGLGRVEPERIAGMLESRRRAESGFTAPAHGLCLLAVLYDTSYDL